MAGMHFIILKVNGVDVSQMPHEEAVQMFLKASEPILVEVRRRSYNNADADGIEYANNSSVDKLQYNNENKTPKQQQQKENFNQIKQQSSPTTISLLTSPAKHQQQLPSSDQLCLTSITATKLPASTVDSLKFNSLFISSSRSSIGLESSSNHRHNAGSSVSGSLPIIATTTRNNNTSASVSTSSQHNSSSFNNQIHTQNLSSGNEISSSNQPASSSVKSRSASISSITSPVKSIPSSPIKESIKTSTLGKDEVDEDSKGFISIGIQTDNFTTDFIFNGSSILNPESIIENDHNLFSECLAPEIDIEEITLRKSEGNERLGLTVCYSSGGGNGSGSDDTDTCTEVYISDIVPDSIAGRDGRLRQGDQILQVNGKDVSNKEETETLIAENNNAVTLLVSRYLYGDDDEYNEQGDYYDEDEPNMAYANCFLDNYIVGEDLVKSAPGSIQGSPEKTQPKEEIMQGEQQQPVRSTIADVVLPSGETLTPKTSNSSSSKDPLNHQNIRAHLEQVNQEIAILDSRVENMMMSQKKNIEPNTINNQLKSSIQPKETSSVMPIMDYDTEHIYETIPEDSESEPFYCSPYESSEHQTRIEQWLGMQDGSDLNESRMRSSLQHQQKHQQVIQQQQQQNHENLTIWTKAKNGTLRSTNSSAGDDHENSSSAYNTGGSCNSNTMTPLTLELNAANYRDREQHSQSTLILCSSNKHVVSPINETTIIQHRLPLQEQSSTHRHSKEKLLSPTHSSAKFSQPMLPTKQRIVPVSQKNSDLAKSNTQNTPISASNTMYTNVANLQQTMLLQQQLFRQALIHQRMPSNSVPCPQFTAPNLSQYHFVSSQEVSTVKLNTLPSEEHMVWKVKRRQDGTRYIVRRPARNRFLRNRALRISAERNDQTTEDDTISEIKTGRYWTKEERKKHIERARERRQRQQIIITNKNNEISPLNMNPEVPQKNSSNCGETLQQTQLQKQPIIQNLSNTTPTTGGGGGKVYRQNTPTTGQSFTKKLVKKITNSSPVDAINNSPLVSSNPSAPVSGTGNVGAFKSATTTTTTTTTTPSGSRMLQGVVGGGSGVGVGGGGGGGGGISDNTYHNRVVHPSL